jgi:hypothetical protein
VELNRDELRRRLRDVDAENRAAMPAWRDALARVFGGTTPMSADEKATLVGVPSPARRTFFRVGGTALVGAAVLAACGDDEEPAQTGGSSSTTAGGADDLTLARTAASLEKLAIDVYGNPDAGALLQTQAIIDAATMFRDHHQAHLDALNGVITDNGGSAIDSANEAVFKALVEPKLGGLEDERGVVMLAYELESAAAQTYVFAGGALSTPALRSTIMTIGGVEARHAAVLQMAALALPPTDVFPDGRGFFPGDNPLAGIDGALIAS